MSESYIIGSEKLPVEQTGAKLYESFILHENTTQTGIGTTMPTNGAGVVSIVIAGQFNAVIVFEGWSADKSWNRLEARRRNEGIISSQTTRTGVYELNVQGFDYIRANVVTYVSGQIKITGRAQGYPGTPDSFKISNVNETQVIFPRTVRSGISDINLEISNNVRGYIFTLVVHSVSGGFLNGQGIRARVFSLPQNSVYNLYTLSTDRSVVAGNGCHHMIAVYPGVNITELLVEPGVGGYRKALSLPVVGRSNFRIDIEGTFAPGEGVDCEGIVTWIL